MENIEEFNVADTMLWQKVKEGLTKKWLENEADSGDLDYLVGVYNDNYDGGIFDNIEDTVYDAFSDVYEAFECAVESDGNYDRYDSWFQIPHYESTLYSWDDSSMLDKLVDEMGSDIRYLAEDIEENKIDPDGTYIEVVKDITLTQRHYSKELENINRDLFEYIENNTYKGYGVADLKENLVGFEEKNKVFDFVPTSDNLTALIDGRNARVKELLDNNGAFLKGALYSTIIENNAKCYNDVAYQFMNYYGLSNEFIERHQQEIDEVNLNFAKIGEFIL